MKHTFMRTIDRNRTSFADYVNGGTLSQLQRRPFKKDTMQFFMAEIVIAIEQLHMLDIIHGDLKLENILLDSDG